MTAATSADMEQAQEGSRHSTSSLYCMLSCTGCLERLVSASTAVKHRKGPSLIASGQ